MHELPVFICVVVRVVDLEVDDIEATVVDRVVVAEVVVEADPSKQFVQDNLCFIEL